MSQFSATSQIKSMQTVLKLKFSGQEKVVLQDQCAKLCNVSGFNIHVVRSKACPKCPQPAM